MPLTPKAYETLLRLVESKGRILEKDALMKALWPDTFVEEGSLSQNVSLVRRALGESEGGETYIETIPRRGYRFAAAVREIPAERIRWPGSTWLLSLRRNAYLAGAYFGGQPA